MGVAAERDVIGKIAVANDNTGGVYPRTTGETFQRHGGLHQLLGLRLGPDRSFQLGIFLDSRTERDVELIGNHFRDPIGVTITQSHDATDVAHNAARLQFAKGDNLRDTPLSIFAPDVIENLAATGLAKVDVDIRRRDPFRIEKTLEN